MLAEYSNVPHHASDAMLFWLIIVTGLKLGTIWSSIKIQNSEKNEDMPKVQKEFKQLKVKRWKKKIQEWNAYIVFM